MESKDLQHGGYKGADVDLANALARAMGLKGARIIPTTFSSIIPALQRRNFDVIMSSMNDTPDRRKQISFVNYMRLTAAEAILVPKSSSLHAAGYAGICGHTISVQAGTAELDDLNTANKSCKSKMDIKSYNLDTDSFQALASGHVDAYTTDLPVALFYVKAHSAAIRFAGKPFGSGATYGIGVAKNATALRAALINALHKIHVNGQYVRILKRYGLGGTAL
jgi:polar amino acid transport system substrate-binding protein